MNHLIISTTLPIIGIHNTGHPLQIKLTSLVNTQGLTDSALLKDYTNNGRKQSGRSPKVVARFSATKFCSCIIELLQLYGRIEIK